MKSVLLLSTTTASLVEAEIDEEVLKGSEEWHGIISYGKILTKHFQKVYSSLWMIKA